MLDCLVKGGVVVDGTGRPGRRADVGVRDGRIVSVGPTDEPAREVVDVDGLVVAPGFVDVHTHYDAQVFWDPTLSPSPLHGVTTVIGGNCGFSIAPLGPEDADYLMRMLARVEGMPLESLEQGVPWDWRTTGEYLDRLEGGLVPNAGFMVGHSALRRRVLHEEATTREATPEEVARMGALLREGLQAGGLGLSSSWSITHSDHTGGPVPSRFASRDELLALCAVVAEVPGTTLEFIPGVGVFSDEQKDVMAAMSRVARRPLNWNVLQVYGQNVDVQEAQLAASDYAEDHGGRVVALTLPDSLRTRLTFASGFLLDALPGWAPFFGRPPEERIAALRDPAQRAELDRMAQTMPGRQRSIALWSSYRLETHSPETARFNGRTVGEVATELGTTPWDALCDIVVADRLATGLYSPDRGQDERSWERRVEVWRDPRAVVGASDAGAHLDMIDSFSYATTLLSRAVRERGLLPLEEAIAMLTDEPARLYGLRGRGRVAEGWAADLVVLDPDRIDPGAVSFRYDLPGGAGRIYGEPTGVVHVVVNGELVVRDGAFTDARPGTLLRAGRDTVTVEV